MFKIIIAFLSLKSFNISLSSSFNSTELSNTAIITSLSFAAFLDFSIPICSILSFAFLMPAVSIILKGIPSIITCSSMISLVVPAISVTIALSSFSIEFNKEDFPAFGLPIIASLRPSFNIFPFSNDFDSLTNS